MRDDISQMIARINPVSRGDADRMSSTEELFADTRGRIALGSHDRSLDRSRWTQPRWIAAAVILVGVLTLPALALSGSLGPLFGFSASGTPVDVATFEKSSLGFLDRLNASPETVKLVAVRGDTAFYAARAGSGGLCLGVGARSASPLSFTQLRCGAGGANSFPSPDVPVLQTSNVFGTEGSSDVFMPRLEGFAADGVSVVEVRGPSGVVARASVGNNVFASDVPHQPVTSIKAYDSNGSEIWARPLTH